MKLFKKRNYQALGEELEQKVLQFYLKQGFQLKAQRYKSHFAEIDLIFISPSDHLILVEVKSAPRPGFEAFRVSASQRVRLRRAHEQFACHYTHVESHLAVVSQDGVIEVHKDHLIF
ncbi:MAG: YraN family protein [Bdellovibrionales bacterium]